MRGKSMKHSNHNSNKSAMPAKTVVIVAGAKVCSVSKACPRVGESAVAYPPFLMAFDARVEGQRAVEERVQKRGG